MKVPRRLNRPVLSRCWAEAGSARAITPLRFLKPAPPPIRPDSSVPQLPFLRPPALGLPRVGDPPPDAETAPRGDEQDCSGLHRGAAGVRPRHEGCKISNSAIRSNSLELFEWSRRGSGLYFPPSAWWLWGKRGAEQLSRSAERADGACVALRRRRGEECSALSQLEARWLLWSFLPASFLHD